MYSKHVLHAVRTRNTSLSRIYGFLIADQLDWFLLNYKRHPNPFADPIAVACHHCLVLSIVEHLHCNVIVRILAASLPSAIPAG